MIYNMGNQRDYIESGGFSVYLYEDHPKWKSVIVNGINAKVLKLKKDKTGTHSGLPSYANTSDVYLKAGKDGDIIQAKVYDGRKHVFDFDWGHEHKNNNGDGKIFPKGVVHVQCYSTIDIGKRYSNLARLMTDKEIEKYGALLKYFNPNVKFRP